MSPASTHERSLWGGEASRVWRETERKTRNFYMAFSALGSIFSHAFFQRAQPTTTVGDAVLTEMMGVRSMF